MYSLNSFREGDESSLATEYIRIVRESKMKLETVQLDNPYILRKEDILAVHYADSGAQGDAGAVNILYCTQNNVRIYHGNYAYGNLDLDEVIRKLPMLKCLNSFYSFSPPFPFGGKIDIPEGWEYLYMGAMNHFYVRESIADKSRTFIEIIIKKIGGWEAFDAIAWLCGVQFDSNE